MEHRIELFKDDRTDEEKKTLTHFVKGRDTFLSGWGDAKGKRSYAVWACKPEHATQVGNWVRGRSDMRNVVEGIQFKSVHAPTYRGDLVHVYAVGDEHPALGGTQ